MIRVSLKSSDMCPYKRKAEGELDQVGEEKTQTH